MIVVPYDSRWPGEFEAERGRIRAALGVLARRIDHHGSTAVPGLAAKPIIDIQVSVERLDPLDLYVVGLARIGYRHLPHADDAFCPFFHRPDTWPHTHHVHLVEAGGEEERRTLAFRDYLRDHVDVAREYQALKEKLADQFDGDSLLSRQAYADAKSEFIASVLRRTR
jgi:GrpB-like predicted nucleotidyltransferase (UPF0157 family)